MYYLSDFNTIEFARRKGSKDKTKRRIKTALKVGLGLGAIGLAAYGGKKLLSRKIFSSITPNAAPVVNKPNYQPTIKVNPDGTVTNLTRSLKKQENTNKIRKRLALITAESNKNIKSVDDLIDSSNIDIRPNSRLVQIDNKVLKQRVKKAVSNLRKNNAYYDIGDLKIISFTRRKGSKDKKKRRRIGTPERLTKGVIGGSLVGGLAAAPLAVLAERKSVRNTNKNIINNHNKIKQQFMSNIDSDSMKVYGDTLHELKKAGLDQHNASVYADQAKHEFIELQKGMFGKPATVKMNKNSILKNIKGGAKTGAIIGLTTAGLGLGLNAYAKRVREHRKLLKKTKNK